MTTNKSNPFGGEKTKSIIFGSKRKLKSLKELDIRCGKIMIKQRSEVTYIGCILDNTLSGESMATHCTWGNMWTTKIIL